MRKKKVKKSLMQKVTTWLVKRYYPGCAIRKIRKDVGKPKERIISFEVAPDSPLARESQEGE